MNGASFNNGPAGGRAPPERNRMSRMYCDVFGRKARSQAIGSKNCAFADDSWPPDRPRTAGPPTSTSVLRTPCRSKVDRLIALSTSAVAASR